MKLIKLCCVIFLLLPLSSMAQAKFVAGKDYKVVPISTTASAHKPNTVTVMEFFNYGCPWCFHLEPALKTWKKTLPKYVEFKRVPLVFEGGWNLYAKAYYIAQALKIESKITPKIFYAIHKSSRPLKTNKQMVAFFVEQGVTSKAADSAFNYSPAIDAKVRQVSNVMKKYKVYTIPTILVGSKYRVSLAMAGGDGKRMMEIVNYLIEQAHQQQQ